MQVQKMNASPSPFQPAIKSIWLRTDGIEGKWYINQSLGENCLRYKAYLFVKKCRRRTTLRDSRGEFYYSVSGNMYGPFDSYRDTQDAIDVVSYNEPFNQRERARFILEVFERCRA